MSCSSWGVKSGLSTVNKETFTLPLSLSSPDASHTFMNGLWKEFQDLHFAQVMCSRHLSIQHWLFLWLLHTCCYMRATLSKLFYFINFLHLFVALGLLCNEGKNKPPKKWDFYFFYFFFLLLRNSSRAIKQEKGNKKMEKKNPTNHWSCRLAWQSQAFPTWFSSRPAVRSQQK